MMSCGKLRQRIDVYQMSETTQDRETDFVPQKTGTIWGNVVPVSGKTGTIPGESIQAEVTHRVTIRAKAIPELSPEVWLVCEGLRLDVLYFYPIYNRPGWTEIFCKAVLDHGGSVFPVW